MAQASKKEARNIWHFKHRKTGLFYMEWKYFNVVAGDISALFSYTLANPCNKLGQRRVVLNYMIFQADKMLAGRTEDISGTRMDLDDENCMTLGNHIISILPDGSVHVLGRSGEESWDLTYRPKTGPMQGLRNYKVGIFSWEDLSWESPIPNAAVTGWVMKGAKRIKINGTGYHDGNWGTWLGFDAKWHWMQVNSKDTSIVLAEIYNREKGNIYIKKGIHEPITIDHRHYKVNHTRWKGKIPIETKIEADDGKNMLRLTITTRAEKTKYYKRPLMLGLGGYISVHTADVSGTITMSRKRTTIKGRGFREYTHT